MKKAALYSSTQKSRSRPPSAAADAVATTPAPAQPLKARTLALLRRHQSAVLVLASVLLTLLVLMAYQATQDPPQEITQDDIDAAVIHTMETKSLQSRAARAAEAVRQSVVAVRGYGAEPDPGDVRGARKGADRKGADKKAADRKAEDRKSAQKQGQDADRPGAESKGGERPSGIGSGVVIVDKGIILTNLHVVHGMKRVVITFHDGSESEADLVSVHPENDLAVLRARTIPDDLPAATLGSSASLKPGDEVVAVGFPFGIGPSVSAGVISGLNREFRSPQGQRVLTQLIQFDAAANPGNSGGPLVNMDGDVVGIVTAIYTPNEARTFIGIGFAATIAVAGNMVGISPF